MAAGRKSRTRFDRAGYSHLRAKPKTKVNLHEEGIRHSSRATLPRTAVREDRVVSEFRLVVLASGTGTNLQAILDQLHGYDGFAVVGVGSDKREARALRRARDAAVEAAVFPREEFADRAARDLAMGDWIEGLTPDLIVPGILDGRVKTLHPRLHAALLARRDDPATRGKSWKQRDRAP